jgi:nitric oxide reductase activation protein
VAEERRARPAVSLLIDQSASTADAHGADGQSVLQTAALAAAAMATALERAGVDCSIAGFSSNGRHAVQLLTVKSSRDPADTAMLQRLQALQSGGSTRLGAALRHATRCLLQQGDGPRHLVLLSDGEAYDIDVHDPRYLAEDAKHAVRAAARRGVRVVCLALAPERSRDAQRIFGRDGVQALRDTAGLPRALARLLG